MNINFASALQSVQVFNPQSSSNTAVVGVAANRSRVDTFTVTCPTGTSGTYQRPVMPASVQVAGPHDLVRATVNGTWEITILESQKAEHAEILAQATAPRVTTYSVYFGDTLLSTTTVTSTWTGTIPTEAALTSAWVGTFLGGHYGHPLDATTFLTDDPERNFAFLFKVESQLSEWGTWERTMTTEQFVDTDWWHLSRYGDGLTIGESGAYELGILKDGLWEAYHVEPDLSARFTYKATYTEGGKVISEYEGKDFIAMSLPRDLNPHAWYVGHHGFDRRSGEWRTFTCCTNEWLDRGGVEPINIGIFSNSTNPFTGLGKLLGMEGTFTNKTSFLTALDKQIAEESKELNDILANKLARAGLDHVTKKITFAEDKDGNIVIEGNISAKEKRRLAQIINGEPELADRIKTQKARMEIAEELRKDGTVDPKTGEVYRADLSDKKFDAARTQLLSDVLRRHGATLKDAANDNEHIKNLLNEFPELADEVEAYKDRLNAPKATPIEGPGEALKVGEQREEKSDAVRSLLSMHRGVLAEATDEEPDFRGDLAVIRKAIYEKIVDKYNEMYSNDPDWQITKFKMEIDEKGRLKIVDVQTWGDDPKANAQAERVMNIWLDVKLGDDDEEGPTIREAAQEVGLAILDAHDAEHGDVKEFRHKIITSGFNYEVLSPDADRVALHEMEMLTRELGSALGNFFGNGLGIENSFGIIFGSKGLLSLDKGTLETVEADAIKQMLAEINDYLTAEEAGEETAGILSSPALIGIAEKLLALKEVMGNIHDKSLIPKDGVVFGVNR